MAPKKDTSGLVHAGGVVWRRLPEEKMCVCETIQIMLKLRGSTRTLLQSDRSQSEQQGGYPSPQSSKLVRSMVTFDTNVRRLEASGPHVHSLSGLTISLPTSPHVPPALLNPPTRAYSIWWWW